MFSPAASSMNLLTEPCPAARCSSPLALPSSAATELPCAFSCARAPSKPMLAGASPIFGNSRDSASRRAASTNPPGKREGAERVVGDVWIETKISAQLIAASGVTSVNYRWRSVRGTVYLIGRAQSRQELATVLGTVRATDGVLQVRQFIEVRPNAKS